MRGILRPLPSKEAHRETIEKIHEVSRERTYSDGRLRELVKREFIRRAEKGRVQGEDVYVAYGQTAAGRYLVVFFILKYQMAALPISARDMTQAERRYYAQQRQTR